MHGKPVILLVDDEPAIRVSFTGYLERSGFQVRESATLHEAKQIFQEQRIDAILLDLNLPDGNGLDWIPELRATQPELPIIVITGAGDVPIAVEAMRRGADHFLQKPVNLEDLGVFLRKSLELGHLRRQVQTRRRLARREEPYFGISPAMREVRELAQLAAENDASVLITGETGTGKGVLARWIHDHSPRASAAFVEVNCSALGGDLLASELFGHARGAFTSAVQDKPGLLEVADGGTLFLDEIGDMNLEVQAKFLKVIEEKQFRRLGEVKIRRSEFRLICATNRDLHAWTRSGKFRQDLLYRIHVFPIHIPPLRERPEDIPGLVRHILVTLGAPEQEIAPEVMDLLTGYSWPGNIREVRNVLERALLLARGGPLELRHFPGISSSGPEAPEDQQPPPTWDLEAWEARHIQRVLEHFNGDTIKAARALGISRASLYRKLKKYRLRPRRTPVSNS